MKGNMNIISILPVATVLLIRASVIAADSTDPGKSGEFFFDKATFGGNGRTCETCHTAKTGTFSIEEAQARFAKDPNEIGRAHV